MKLKGQQKKIIDLEFSHTLNVLVSSGADAQVCLLFVYPLPSHFVHSHVYRFKLLNVWPMFQQLYFQSIDRWEKRKSKILQVQIGRSSPPVGDTRVQFHNDQVHLLVVHKSQHVIYDASKFDRLHYVSLSHQFKIQIQ